MKIGFGTGFFANVIFVETDLKLGYTREMIKTRDDMVVRVTKKGQNARIDATYHHPLFVKAYNQYVKAKNA